MDYFETLGIFAVPVFILWLVVTIFLVINFIAPFFIWRHCIHMSDALEEIRMILRKQDDDRTRSSTTTGKKTSHSCATVSSADPAAMTPDLPPVCSDSHHRQSIRIECPGCKGVITLCDASQGAEVVCKQCGEKFIVE